MTAKHWGLRPWKRHSLVLIVVGLIFVFVGIGYILSKNTPGRNASLRVLLQIAPMEFWGGVFVFAGVLSILSSKWPAHAEKWGYAVLTGLSLGWGSAYLMGILFTDSPWININGFFLWGLLGFLLWAISGLQNPDKMAVINTNGTG